MAATAWTLSFHDEQKVNVGIITVIKSNHDNKFMKIPFAIYAEMDYLIGKKLFYENNPEEWLTSKWTKKQRMFIIYWNIVHLTAKKVTMISRAMKNLSKSFVMIWRNAQ